MHMANQHCTFWTGPQIRIIKKQKNTVCSASIVSYEHEIVEYVLLHYQYEY